MNCSDIFLVGAAVVEEEAILVDLEEVVDLISILIRKSLHLYVGK